MSIPKLAERLLDAADRLATVAEAGEAALRKPYAPGKWNGVQLMAHIADADVVFLTRFWKAVAEPSTSFEPFDQDRYVVELQEAERPLEISVGLIVSSREAIAHLLRTLPPDALQRSARRSGGQALTAVEMAEKLAWHAEHHLEQLDAILDGKTWTPKQS
jgi:hypothetical protein